MAGGTLTVVAAGAGVGALLVAAGAAASLGLHAAKPKATNVPVVARVK